jgi:hypothetical protein
MENNEKKKSGNNKNYQKNYYRKPKNKQKSNYQKDGQEKSQNQAFSNNPKKVKVKKLSEETTEDIINDIERIEKEIELEIREIQSAKFSF